MLNIKEEDLLSLHKQIEDSEVKQKELEEILSVKTEKLTKVGYTRKKILLVCVGTILFAISLTGYFSYANNSKNKIVNNVKDYVSSIETEIETLREELNELKQEKVNIEQIKELYLYRNLIRKEKVYSVQMTSFSKNKIPLVSEKYTNTMFYSDSLYYKFSLGIFETLPEAQEFRNFLISSGFDDRIFVISYKDGKRLRIENAE